MTAAKGFPGGANIALTTTEQVVDLSALGGYQVALVCNTQDWLFSFAPGSETSATPTLVTAATPVSTSTYVADPVGATIKIVREVTQPFTKLVCKCSSGTGTLVIKPVQKV